MAEQMENHVILITWTSDENTVACAVINPTSEALSIDPPEGWNAYTAVVQGDTVQPDAENTQGSISVAPQSVTLAVRAD